MARLPKQFIGGLLIAWFALLAAVSVVPAFAKKADQFAATLNPKDRAAFEAWYSAQVFFGAATDAYWAKVERKRRVRKRKRRARRAFGEGDYVTTLPPKYGGPRISKKMVRSWRSFRDRDKPKPPPGRRTTLPNVADYLAAARRHFNFAPERISETEYKRRYAREALSFGLTKDQIVRIFALETGGNGTADMQAGIHPITKRGRPISSALGYAQLLAANSVNVLSKHGRKFEKRLGDLIRRTPPGPRRRELERKLRVLSGMIRIAKSVPYKWSRHRALARTSRGMSLHVMNIDGVVGPWMQVTKIADLKKLAERRGLYNLSGAEIELMNLAGPATGLEMMRPLGRNKPTSNFFSRRAYNRNSIVRGRTSSGLLEALENRMRQNIKKKGAQEFLAIFDELEGRQRPKRAATGKGPPKLRFYARD